MAAKHKTKIATRLEDVPAGFVQLSTYGITGNCQKSPGYRAVQDAYAAGRLEAWKLIRGPRDSRGPVYVAKAAADAIAAAATAPAPSAIPVSGNENAPRGLFDERPAGAATPPPPTPGLLWTAELQHAAVLGILNAAERIATALEDLAEMHEADAAPRTGVFQAMLRRIRHATLGVQLSHLDDDIAEAEASGQLTEVEVAELMGAIAGQSATIRERHATAEAVG